jgi:hypothetical protein
MRGNRGIIADRRPKTKVFHGKPLNQKPKTWACGAPSTRLMAPGGGDQTGLSMSM